jgi:hypothetical protein
MEGRCPYCLAPMEVEVYRHKLTLRELGIFRTVANAGPQGVSVEEIIGTCIPGKKAATVRSAISYLNIKISPKRLVSKSGRYYLKNTDLEEPSDEVHSVSG